MLISSEKILQSARDNGYAFPHFNYWDSNSIRAELAAAENRELPVILAWAQKHSGEIGVEDALSLGKYYGSTAKVPVVLHLDHGTDPDFVKWCAAHGFSSVMIDASAEKYDDNVKITRDVVHYAHQLGVPVEAEIGHVGTNSSTDNSTYTEVEAAVQFVKETKVDSLAVSIGTSHGVYQQGTPKLNFKRIAELKGSLNVPLVCHGGSSSGDENLRKAVEMGISKVNIFTDLANAALKVAQEKEYSSQFEFSVAQRDAVQSVAEHYYDVFATEKYSY
ncbi:class II fructose-bisphosphate aldolase [Lactobacillus sp. ESL0791]|uniref:class II fructose-bisphosphate aldolase n=1 Tax=Lactobacillus sp. ESL0791 TaxID=2983234 RepID=UPI0023F7C58A|nr:class II fructose-bisphosphate aldolase [Lactobacillus sp. ESL0791]MDF7639591.1 class II fructose-bisphosphate aldolase [Lactobacillus sp. ESL0791]